AVLQQVLSVGAAVFHAAHHADQFSVKTVDPQIDAGAFAHLHDLVLKVFAGLPNDFFDPRGMDPSVLHQLVQRQTRDLTTHGIEAAEDDRAGRIVHDDLHAGGLLQGADVPSFATDDPAFHIVVIDVEHAH